MFLVGGWCSGDAIASVERFDPQSADWKMVAPMSKRRCGVGVAVLNDLLYAVGGHDGQSYLNSTERFVKTVKEKSKNVIVLTFFKCFLICSGMILKQTSGPVM